MGWERGINKTFREAPQFMWIYTVMIVFAALVILTPNAPLVFLMVLSSVLNGMLLPFVLVYALSLVNDRKIMGEYVNPRFHNVVSWGTVGVLTVLTILFIISFLLPEGAFYG